jgi:PEP-CTERM motif
VQQVTSNAIPASYFAPSDFEPGSQFDFGGFVPVAFYLDVASQGLLANVPPPEYPGLIAYVAFPRIQVTYTLATGSASPGLNLQSTQTDLVNSPPIYSVTMLSGTDSIPDSVLSQLPSYLVSTPEPGSIWMAALGLSGLMAVRRNRLNPKPPI